MNNNLQVGDRVRVILDCEILRIRDDHPDVKLTNDVGVSMLDGVPVSDLSTPEHAKSSASNGGCPWFTGVREDIGYAGDALRGRLSSESLHGESPERYALGRLQVAMGTLVDHLVERERNAHMRPKHNDDTRDLETRMLEERSEMERVARALQTHVDRNFEDVWQAARAFGKKHR